MTTHNNGTDVLGGCLASIFGQSFDLSAINSLNI